MRQAIKIINELNLYTRRSSMSMVEKKERRVKAYARYGPHKSNKYVYYHFIN